GARGELVRPFPEAEKAGEQRGAREQPWRCRYMDCNRAAQHPKQKPNRNREHVEKHEMLDAQRVGQVERKIAERRKREPAIERDGTRKSDRRKAECCPSCASFG